MTGVWDDIYAKLSEPLPAEALSQHPTKAYLTEIKPAYVVERLNDVLGIEGWYAEFSDIETEGKMVVKKCTLSIFNSNGDRVIRSQYGGNDNSDRGDAHKGAATDAFTKSASLVGVGREVYLNLVKGKPRGKQAPATKPATITKPDSENMKKLKELLNNAVINDQERERMFDWANRCKSDVELLEKIASVEKVIKDRGKG